MREKIKDYDRLLHIQEAIDNVFEFMSGKTVNDLANDKLLFYGVVKNIEIIGEASYMLTKEFISNHPDTPWIDIIGMRHVLVHGYYTASPVFIFDTYKNDLGALKIQIDSYISELKQQTSVYAEQRRIAVGNSFKKALQELEEAEKSGLEDLPDATTLHSVWWSRRNTLRRVCSTSGS